MTTSTPSRPISRSGSPLNALSASASSTSGTPVRSSRPCTNAAVPGSCPRPGPTAITSAWSSSTRSSAAKSIGAGRRFVERHGHVFRAHRREDRQRRSRRRDRHQPGARPQRAERRQMGRAGLPHRARDDQHAAEVPLVRLGRRGPGGCPASARASAVRDAALRDRRGSAPGSRCRRSPDRRRANRPEERPAESSGRRA